MEEKKSEKSDSNQKNKFPNKMIHEQQVGQDDAQMNVSDIEHITYMNETQHFATNIESMRNLPLEILKKIQESFERELLKRSQGSDIQLAPIPLAFGNDSQVQLNFYVSMDGTFTYATLIDDKMDQSYETLKKLHQSLEREILMKSKGSTIHYDQIANNQGSQAVNSNLRNAELISSNQICYKLRSLKSFEIKMNDIILNNLPYTIIRPAGQYQETQILNISETNQLTALYDNKVMKKVESQRILQVGDKFQIKKFFIKVEEIDQINMNIQLRIMNSRKLFIDVCKSSMNADESQTIIIGQKTLPKLFKNNYAIIKFENGQVFLNRYGSNNNDYSLWYFLVKDIDQIPLQDSMQIKIGYLDLLEFNEYVE